MKKFTPFRWFTMFSLLALILMACASNQSSDFSGMDMDMATEQSSSMHDMEMAESNLEQGVDGELDLGEKIIETASMSYEAVYFDDTLVYVEELIEANDAQVQHSSRWQSSSSYGFLGERISMTIRIPQEQLHHFIDTLNAYDDLVIQYQDFVRTDVTKQYRDNDTRIAILKEEETALREMLQEQGSLEEILQIRTRLSELVTEREIFENQNKSYDEQVAYSTLNLDIQETDRANSRDTRGFWDRITNALVDSLFRFIAVGQNLVISFIYLIPYLIIFGIVGGIVFYIIRKRRSNRNI